MSEGTPDAVNPESDVGLTEAERDAIEAAEAQPLEKIQLFGLETGLRAYWTKSAEAQKSYPLEWVTAPGSAPDLAHLPTPVPSGTLTLTSGLLKSWAAANAMALPESGPVLFGIRGAGLARKETGWTSSIDLAASEPDHMTTQCVLGVLDAASGSIVAFTGSTVPNANQMYASLLNQKAGRGPTCNLMPTGAYAYVSGPHRGLASCFVDCDSYMVRRAGNSMAYEVEDWYGTPGRFGNHIHLAFFSPQVPPPPTFSSAGCQTVAGTAPIGTSRYKGDFESFRVAAGLPPASSLVQGSSQSSDGQAYTYLLVGFGELAFTAAPPTGQAAPWFRRHGSDDRVVAALRTALGLAGAGRWDGALTQGLVRWQLDNGFTATGILDRTQATALGVVL